MNQLCRNKTSIESTIVKELATKEEIETVCYLALFSFVFFILIVALNIRHNKTRPVPGSILMQCFDRHDLREILLAPLVLISFIIAVPLYDTLLAPLNRADISLLTVIFTPLAPDASTWQVFVVKSYAFTSLAPLAFTISSSAVPLMAISEAPLMLACNFPAMFNLPFKSLAPESVNFRFSSFQLPFNVERNCSTSSYLIQLFNGNIGFQLPVFKSPSHFFI
jgi:hypothetical protein